MKRKKWMIVIIVILAIIAGIVFVFNKKDINDVKNEESNNYSRIIEDSYIMFINIPYGKEVVLSEESTQSLNIILEGNKDILDELNFDNDDFQPYLDLAGLDIGTYEVPVFIKFENKDVITKFSQEKIKIIIKDSLENE